MIAGKTSPTLRRSKEDELKATAYHEAGHAVAIVMLGARLKTITIVPGDGYLGLADHHAIPLKGIDIEVTPLRRDRAEKSMLISLTGRVAEEHHTGRRATATARQDTRNVIDVLSYFVSSNEEMAAYFKLLNIRASQFIIRHWQLVERVATTVLDRSTLNADEVRDAMFGDLNAKTLAVVKEFEQRAISS